MMWQFDLVYIYESCTLYKIAISAYVFLCFRGLRSGRQLEDDLFVPELAHIHPRERPDWEETISAMVRHVFSPPTLPTHTWELTDVCVFICMYVCVCVQI